MYYVMLSIVTYNNIVLLSISYYGKFSNNHVCFCGLDPGNLKSETVRTYKRHVCFKDLRRSI